MPRRRTDRPGALFVLTSADRRGAETEGRNVGNALRERGVEVSVLALSPAKFGNGLDVEVIGAKPLAWATLRELRKRASNCGTVIAFGSTSLPACATATVGLRSRLIYRSIGNPRDWVRGRAHRLRTGIFFRQVDHVAALWTDAAVSFGDLYGTPVNRRSVIPNFRSTAIFRPTSAEGRQAARLTYGYADSDLVVVFVGALSKEKRPELAVAAIAQLPEAKLLVAGDGPLRPVVEAQAAELAPNQVQFLGSVDDVFSIYRAADVVLLTSSTEGMPGVLLEAALSGVPAASSEVGSVADLARSGCCIETFAPGSTPADVAAVIRRAGGRTDEALAAVGRVADQFSSEAVVQRWVDLLSASGKS